LGSPISGKYPNEPGPPFGSLSSVSAKVPATRRPTPHMSGRFLVYVAISKAPDVALVSQNMLREKLD
jgi:hypothetical protein